MPERRVKQQMAFWSDTERIINVASVPQRSPFRYPGGKTWLVPRIRCWLASLPFKPKKFVEPFAGGAIVGLTVAFENLADSVILVERDEQVASVWQTIISNAGGAQWLADRIATFDLTMESASELLSSPTRTIRETALKTLVQNRISHGGILAEGAGILKYGEKGKGIRSRWYPETLRKRILAIAQVRQRIKFVPGDGFQVIQAHLETPGVVFFVDPPYTASSKKAGARLYKHHQIDHRDLFEKMSRVAGDFLLTYDDAEEVRALALEYRFETRLVAMSNTHHAKMNELLIGRNLSWVDGGF